MVDDRDTWGLVPIYHPDDSGTECRFRPQGTGIALNCRTVATARHVIDPSFRSRRLESGSSLSAGLSLEKRCDKICIKGLDAAQIWERPIDVKLHPDLDLALLRFGRPVVETPAVWVFDLDDVPLRDLENWTLIRAGYPADRGGETFEFTETGSDRVRVEAARDRQARTFLRVHGLARHGYSGGALLRDLCGQIPSVVGLLYIGREEAAIMGAIPTGDVLRFAAGFGWRPARIAFAAESLPDESDVSNEALIRRQHLYARAYRQPDLDGPHFTLSEDDLAIPMAVIPPGRFQYPQTGLPGRAEECNSQLIARPYAIMRSVVTPHMIARLLNASPDPHSLDLPLTGITFREAEYLAVTLSNVFGRNIVLADRARWQFALFPRGPKVATGAKQGMAAHPWGVTPAPDGRYEWVIDPDFLGSKAARRGALCRDPGTPAPLMYAGDREVRPEATVRFILEL